MENSKHLFVFGDSFTAITWDGKFERPTNDTPMGIEWPGFTSCEFDTPNYIGHLFYMEDEARNTKPPFYVYNYAVPGHTVPDQLKLAKERFLPWEGTKPEWASWDSESALFIIQIGINDCSRFADGDNIESRLNMHMELVQLIYDAGARNLVLIDVPPIERCPVALPYNPSRKNLIQKRVTKWNALLSDNITELAVSHPDLTVIPFSFHDIFTRILDDPVQYGFEQADTVTEGGRIWFDHLHPTTAIHSIIAWELRQVLSGSPSSPLQVADPIPKLCEESSSE